MHCTSFVVVVVSLRFFIYLSQYFTVPRRKFESPYPGKAQQPQEQRYPFLPVCVVFLCVQTMVYGCQNLEYLTCTQILMNAIAHGGGTDTVRESALETDWEKNPLPHRGFEPASVLRLAFQSDAGPPEPSPTPDELMDAI